MQLSHLDIYLGNSAHHIALLQCYVGFIRSLGNNINQQYAIGHQGIMLHKVCQRDCSPTPQMRQLTELTHPLSVQVLVWLDD